MLWKILWGFHWKTKSLYWSRNIGKIMGYKWYPICKSWWCKTGVSREMCNVNSWWVFVATHYSNMAMVGVAKCLKVFSRGTLVKNPSGAGRRSLRWETICWKCKEALGWTWKALYTWRQQCVLARKYEAPSKRIRTSLHAYLSWLGLENPHFSIYTEGCKTPGPTKDSSIKAFFPKADWYSPKEPNRNGGMATKPALKTFSDFLPTNTLRCKDIKRQTGYWW